MKINTKLNIINKKIFLFVISIVATYCGKQNNDYQPNYLPFNSYNQRPSGNKDESIERQNLIKEAFHLCNGPAIKDFSCTTSELGQLSNEQLRRIISDPMCVKELIKRNHNPMPQNYSYSENSLYGNMKNGMNNLGSKMKGLFTSNSNQCNKNDNCYKHFNQKNSGNDTNENGQSTNTPPSTEQMQTSFINQEEDKTNLNNNEDMLNDEQKQDYVQATVVIPFEGTNTKKQYLKDSKINIYLNNDGKYQTIEGDIIPVDSISMEEENSLEANNTEVIVDKEEEPQIQKDTEINDNNQSENIEQDITQNVNDIGTDVNNPNSTSIDENNNQG